MASIENAIVQLIRNREIDNVVITGMAFSTGSRYMTSEEKIKTIIDPKTYLPVDPVLETGKVVKGLGIERVSVADMGEDTITSAALAVIKLALLYNVRLDEITALTFATESPEDISKDHAINTIKAVNDAVSVLKKHGYNLGYLNPKDAPHVQSACVAGVSNLAEKARVGIRGKTIIVTSDEARYQLGSSADETGGFGSTAVLLEEANKNSNKGLVISSEMIGHARKSVVDFSKPLTRVTDEESGVGLINRYPIVFGNFSEHCYINGTFESAKKAFETNMKTLIDWKGFVDQYLIAPHAPYPKMYEKALIDLMKEMAKHDPGLLARLKKETGMEIPYLDGFKDQGGQLGFIIDIVNNSVKLDRIITQIKRLEEGPKNKLFKEVQMNLGFMAQSIVIKFDEIKGKYKLSDGLIRLMDKTQEKLEKASKNGKCVEDLKDSFDEILKHIENFEIEDKEYTKRLKKCEVFSEFMTKLRVAKSYSLSEEIGNIYTGSAFLSLGSLIINLSEEIQEGKKVILVGYGSGFEARTLILDGKNRELSYIHDALVKNREFEFGNRKSVTADEYKSIRSVKNVENAGTILVRYEDFVKVNEIKLLEMARNLTTERAQIRIKNVSRSV